MPASSGLRENAKWVTSGCRSAVGPLHLGKSSFDLHRFADDSGLGLAPDLSKGMITDGRSNAGERRSTISIQRGTLIRHADSSTNSTSSMSTSASWNAVLIRRAASPNSMRCQTCVSFSTKVRYGFTNIEVDPIRV